MTWTLKQAEEHQRKVAAWRSGKPLDARKPRGRKPAAEPAYRAPEVQNGALTVVLPIKLVNGANAREHWHERSKRAKVHRDIVSQFIPRRLLPPLPAQVNIVRIGPRRMDCDGNAIAAKHLRDGIADLFALDDGSPLIRWEYGQEYGEYGVRVEIRPV